MADQPLHLSERAGPARRVSDRLGAPYPGAVLAAVVGAAIVASLGPAFGDPEAMVLAMAVYVAGALLALGGLALGYPHADFGPANTVTLLRLALAAVLVAAVPGAAQPIPWALPALAALSLALDGVDGWLARRTGLASRFGARFDMEVDCVFALALSLLVFESGKIGIWVLGLGLARYAFCAASLALPWLARPLPERRSRKVVCVAQIAVLIALVTPLVQPPFASMLAAAMLACVAWSFAVDIGHLRRARP